MTVFHAGASGFARRRHQYARRLKFVEWTPPEATPRPGTLIRWRSELPKDFLFSLVLPPALWGERDWPLRDTAALERGVQWLRHAVEALRPTVLVVRSPAAVRPGSGGLRRMLELLPRLKPMAQHIVWEPAGLWERDEAVAAVAGTGVLVACDPLRDKPKGEATVYARLRGMGAQRNWHAGRLEDLVLALRHCETAFVVFDSDNALVEAVRFERIAAGADQLAELSEDEGPVFENADDDYDQEDEDGDDDEGEFEDDDALEDGEEDGDDEDLDDGDEEDDDDEDFEDDDEDEHEDEHEDEKGKA